MPQKLFFFAEMGYIYIEPIYIKRQSDSDNFLTFWYTLVDTRDLAEAFNSAVEVVVQNGRGTTQLKATQSSLTNHQNFNWW